MTENNVCAIENRIENQVENEMDITMSEFRI